MNTTKSIIAQLRAQGLDDYQILEQLDAAKEHLDLIESYDLRDLLRQHKPNMHIQSIYRMHERHPEKLPGMKINDKWFYDREPALKWVEAVKAKAEKRKAKEEL